MCNPSEKTQWEQDTRERIAKEREICVLRARLGLLSCFPHLSVNLVAWHSNRIFVSGVSLTRTTRRVRHTALPWAFCRASRAACLLAAAMGHPDKLLCVFRLELTWPRPLQPGVGHFNMVSCIARTARTQRHVAWLQTHVLGTFVHTRVTYTQLERRGAHARDRCGKGVVKTSCFYALSIIIRVGHRAFRRNEKGSDRINFRRDGCVVRRFAKQTEMKERKNERKKERKKKERKKFARNSSFVRGKKTKNSRKER